MACSSQCRSCSIGVSNCTSCASSYFFYYNGTSNTNLCLSQCPFNTFSSNSICVACVSPCLTCSSPNTCLSCISTFFVISVSPIQCVTACPSNSYAYQQQCISCSPDCSLCSASGCMQCLASYFSSPPTAINSQNYYQCYVNCPNIYPYTIGSSCSSCPQNCKACNSSDCIECASGLSAYGLFCLTQCPPDMESKAGVCVSINKNSTANTRNDTNSNKTNVTVV